MQINKVFDSTWDMPIFDKRNDFLETSTATMDYVTEKLIFEKTQTSRVNHLRTLWNFKSALLSNHSVGLVTYRVQGVSFLNRFKN